MTASTEPARPRGRADLETWVRRGCALIVAGVAAYSSYEHQREFALVSGADPINAGLWPLSVDGLLLLATVGRSHNQDGFQTFAVIMFYPPLRHTYGCVWLRAEATDAIGGTVERTIACAYLLGSAVR